MTAVGWCGPGARTSIATDRPARVRNSAHFTVFGVRDIRCIQMTLDDCLSGGCNRTHGAYKITDSLDMTRALAPVATAHVFSDY